MSKKDYYTIRSFERSTYDCDEVSGYEFYEGNSCQLHIQRFENAKAIAELAGLEHYKIFKNEDSFDRKVWYVTKDLKAWEKAVEEKGQMEKLNKKIRSDLMQQLPVRYYYFQSKLEAIPEPGPGSKIEITADWKAAYNPKKSNKIYCDARIKIRLAGVEEDFDLWNYETRDGKIQRKKLADDLSWKLVSLFRRVDKETKHTAPTDITTFKAEIAANINNIFEDQKDVRKVFRRLADNRLYIKESGAENWNLMGDVAIAEQLGGDEVMILSQTGSLQCFNSGLMFKAGC